MDARLGLVLLLALAITPGLAVGLTARVEPRQGVPTLLLNGQPVPPMLVLHTAGTANAMACAVGPEWRRFGFSFRAPVDDDAAALHVRCVTPAGDWYLDDVRWVEGPDAATGENLLRGGEFEGDQLPDAWSYFLNDSTGAKAEYSLDRAAPHGGQSCLRVHIERPGTVGYQIHLYQRVAIQKGRQYSVALWLRSPQARVVELQVVKQGPPWTIYGGDGGPSDRLIALGAERGLHLTTFPLELPWPEGGQPASYAGPDAVLEHILGIDPQALLVPRIHLDAPAAWKQVHLDQQQVYDNGPHPMTSPASDAWRRDAEAALRGLLRHLEERYGEHMLGYHVTAQSAGEWFYDHGWEKPLPCFEEPFRRWFAGWAQRKYGSEAALRTAWGQPAVTFATVRVPTAEERRAGLLGVFRDPVRQRFEIDFADAMQDCLAEAVAHFARVTREETGGRKLSVFFYGYLFEVSGFYNGPAVSGHLRLRQVLDCPDIDLVAAPISYFDRQAGGSGPFMVPVDSVRAHGKLWVNEDDTRTHLAAPDVGYGRTDTEAETLGVYRRNLGHQLEQRCATWYMDFGTGWMAHPTLFDNFARSAAIWRETPPVPGSPQVAVIVDERCLTSLRGDHAVTSPAISLLRAEFNRIGCPIGVYLLDDLLDGRVPADVRCLLLLNAWRLDAGQRRALKAQLRDGRTAFWLYAPGYLDDRGGSADGVAELVGFGVTETTAPKTGKIELQPQPAASFTELPAGVIGTDFRPSPQFAVAPGQPGVVTLGTWQGTGEVAMAVKRQAGWTSVYCGGLSANAALLRAVARAAGAWIHADSNDVVSAGPDFVSLHATSGGEKVLRLARPAALRDAFTGERLARAAEHRFALPAGQTRLFRVEP